MILLFLYDENMSRIAKKTARPSSQYLQRFAVY